MPLPLTTLYLDLNSFFASVEQQLRPELRGRPVAVVPMLSDATCAIAASYEAKAYGIKTGTKIYDAKRMCPQLICVPAEHGRYVDFHARIKRTIESIIPIERVESIDEFSCILDKTQRSPEAARALAERIKEALHHEVGAFIRSSIGIAPNRFLAKTASNLQKPNGLQILFAEDMPARMKDACPSKLVGIGSAMHLRLARCGIFTIEQLYAQPRARLRAIWGSVEGERFYLMLRGVEVPRPPTTKRHVGHSHVLDPAWRSPAHAQEVMRRLLQKATSRLRRYGYYASAMSLSVRVENGAKLRADAHFYRCCDTPSLQHEMLTLWSALMQAHSPRRLKKISIVLHGLTHEGALQPELFDAPSQVQRQQRAESLSRAMDALNRRFGRDSIALGGLPHRNHGFSGTKIAFTRIPQTEEFYE